MSDIGFLVLGGGEGWHASRLAAAAAARGCRLSIARYETLAARVGDSRRIALHCEAGPLERFAAILTRTMPAGSLEQITFRLATLHALPRPPIVNPPRSLEIAIDKFATLAHVARLGYAVPETVVVQGRSEAMDAFDSLGGDCVVKPIFGGEGRGVMRIRDRELAWYTFSTLEGLSAVLYLQAFVSPGGIDTRLLVIGPRVLAFRRENRNDFRTNLASGAICRAFEPDQDQISMAFDITRSIGLHFASVDLLESDDGTPRVLEVNAIPGWRGAQAVCPEDIAGMILDLLSDRAETARCEKRTGAAKS